MGRDAVELIVRRKGYVVVRLTAEADLKTAASSGARTAKLWGRSLLS
jgi:hypothetical protein